jgi:hypothetical protein
MGTINHPLTAAANFFQQFIIPKVAKYFCRPRSFFSIRDGQAIIAVGITELGYKIVIDQPKAGS